MTKYERTQYYISIILKCLIAALVVISAFEKEFFLVFTSLVVLFITFLPSIINRSFRIKLPTEIDFSLTLILYLHYALGEYSHFYVNISWWDILLHAGNSLILGLVGFTVAYSLLLTSRIVNKPSFVSFFAVSFAVFIGVIWEIFEFSMDHFFGFTMQKSGLVDTMTDLIVDVVGASVIGVLGFFYMKYRKPGFFHSLILRLATYKKGKN